MQDGHDGGGDGGGANGEGGGELDGEAGSVPPPPFMLGNTVVRVGTRMTTNSKTAGTRARAGVSSSRKKWGNSMQSPRRTADAAENQNAESQFKISRNFV